MLTIDTKKKKAVLDVKIGAKKYAIPLAKNMPVELADELGSYSSIEDEEQRSAKAYSFFIRYFSLYLGDAMKDIDNEDFAAIMEAWNAESEKTGVSAGE